MEGHVMNLLKSHKTFGGLTQFWEHASTVTQTPMRFSTYIPSSPPKGCLMWLSGLTCTEENFIAKAGAQRFLNAHQLMVVCPDTSPRGTHLPDEHKSDDFGSGAGFYLDATTPGYSDHYRMETYVTAEMYEWVAQHFSMEGKISLSGHSMGGHGALTLGLRHPHLFQSVSAFSPIVHPAIVPWGRKAFQGYLGTNEESWKSHDAAQLIRAGHKHPKPLLIDQGLSDPFLETQLRTPLFQEACQAHGQPAEVRMQDGYDHSYYFVSTFIEDHIAFHAEHLHAKP
jgi:S-formylglutathione hydrolase